MALAMSASARPCILSLILASLFLVQVANAATTTITISSYSETTLTSLGWTFTLDSTYQSTTSSRTTTKTVSCPEGYGTLGDLCFAPASDYFTQPPSRAPGVVYTTTFNNVVPTTISNSITTWAPLTTTITASDFYCPTPYVLYYRGGCYEPEELSSLMASAANTNRTVYVLAESTTATTATPWTTTSGSLVMIAESSPTGSGVISVRTSAVSPSATSVASATSPASAVASATSALATSSASAASASTVAPSIGNGAGDIKAGSGIAMLVALMAVAASVVLMLSL